MKGKLKRFSHSTLAFVLTMCMLLACVNVGVIDADAADTIDAGGSSNWKIYLSDFTTYNNAYNTDITINTSGRLSDGYLKLWLEDENKNKYGGEEKLNYGGSVIAASGRDDAVWLANADIYSDVTVRITWDNGAKVEWISGTLNTVDVAAGVITGQTSYGSATVTLNSSLVSSVAPGTQVDFNATANTGYSFVGWYSDAAGNTLVSEANPYHVTINNAATYYAKFEKTKDEYYNVNFTAGPHGSVSAKANGDIAVTSGKTVKWGTKVVFTAEKDTGYKFTKWTGTNGESTINTNEKSYTIIVKNNIDIKAWFAADNDGSDDTQYFVYNTNQDHKTWTNTEYGKIIKYKNGRAYGYIENPGLNTYYFSVANTANPGSSVDDINQAGGIWSWDGDGNANFQCKTDFNQFVTTDVVNSSNATYGSGKIKLGKVTVTSDKVTRLIIDLGNYNDGFSFDYNTFRVIPEYDTDETNVDIYAKNGSYRGNDWYDFFNTVGTTTITSGATNITKHTNMSTATASRGDTITVQTVVNDTDYYVKGFVVNGVTPELYEEHSDNIYTLTYTIPSDFAYDYLEITPVYYFKASAGIETVLFVVENYDQNVQDTGWGNTLSVYPYYFVSGKDDLNTRDNAFGGYPGQPILNYGGRRFIEVPTSYTVKRNDRNSSNSTTYPALGDTAIIKGITLSNDYWDVVHRDYVHEVDDHLQTYDYDDFYKIYRETNDHKEINYTINPGDYEARKNVVDQITFKFKYRTTLDNFGTTRYSETSNNVMPSTITKADYETNTGNGWDEYLDYYDRKIDIFGRILDPTAAAKDPLLVVSNGYEYTHAGYYATTWTVYSPDGQTKIGTVSPSILEIWDSNDINATNYPNSQGRTDGTYPTMKQLSDFKATYEALKSENYVNRPVLITYEKALRNVKGETYNPGWGSDPKTYGEVATRSDGVWLYSYYNDKITANIRIDYKNSESDAKWTTDEFKSGTNTGTVTKASAYFNGNTDYTEINGKHTTEGVDILSDPNKSFKFTATQAGGYVFQGWWLEKEGIQTPITNELLGNSAMISNATFVAHYVKAPTGTLTINHTLLDGSVGGGDTYVKVVAKKDGNEVVLTSSGTDGFVKNQFEINSDYVSYRSGYTFEVTLKTVPENEFSVFGAFSAEKDGHSPGYLNSSNNSTSGNVTTNTFTVNVNDLFELDSETGFPTQKFDSLTYYSNLTVAEYNYEFVFKYTSYDGVYGGQSATVKGKFSADELNNYMKLENGDLSFKSDNDKIAFLNSVAPYENNFMTDLSWNTEEVVPVFSNGTLSGEVASTENPRKINLYIKFPYAHKGESDKFAVDGDSAVKLSAPVVEPVVTYAPEYGKVLSFNNIHENFLSDTPEYLTAPEKITDGSTELYFRYWTITTNTDGYNDVEYARSYNYEFDYVLFQDCTIEPVYTALKDGEEAPTPRTELQKDDTGVTITFMENSRNQYNNNGCGSITDTNRMKQGDRIYTDFLISANTVIKDDNNNPVELNTLDKGTWTAGLVIQHVDSLKRDSNSDEYIVEDESVYKERYADRIDVDTVNEIASGAYSATPKGYLVSEFDAANFNNKNRINYYYSMPNRDHVSLATSPYQYQVYCAYAYLRNADGTKVYVSEVPVFFTIYEIGNTGNDVEPID